MLVTSHTYIQIKTFYSSFFSDAEKLIIQLYFADDISRKVYLELPIHGH